MLPIPEVHLAHELVAAEVEDGFPAVVQGIQNLGHQGAFAGGGGPRLRESPHGGAVDDACSTDRLSARPLSPSRVACTESTGAGTTRASSSGTRLRNAGMSSASSPAACARPPGPRSPRPRRRPPRDRRSQRRSPRWSLRVCQLPGKGRGRAQAWPRGTH